MHADGTDPEPVTSPEDDYDANEPAWSPDGRRIAFTGETQHNYQVFVSDASGASLRKVTRGCDLCQPLDFEPAWQPLR
jgi:Tol biopolymer transport system component